MPDTTTPLTEGQRGAIERAGASHGTLTQAQNHLYRALGRAAPGREREWADRVLNDLAAARAAIAAHRAEVEGEVGLYGELRFEAPWLLGRLRQLANQLERLASEARDLEFEVERVREGDVQPLPLIRGQAEVMLLSLRDVMAKEADLVWERFNEPVALD
jgi:hypothetical protein